MPLWEFSIYTCECKVNFTWKNFSYGTSECHNWNIGWSLLITPFGIGFWILTNVLKVAGKRKVKSVNRTK